MRHTHVIPFCRAQQISWKAAAAITLKFRRLFDPSIPDGPEALCVLISMPQQKGCVEGADCAGRSDFFPSAHQIITKDVATLRTAGLSARKAEYSERVLSRSVCF